MNKLICKCCCAPIVPTTTQPFLTCAYCDASMPNPYYSQSDAAEAAQPSLEETCLSALLEMGASQNLAKLDPDCFGTPINGIDAARAGLSISDSHNVYLLYAHTFLLIAFSDGLALTDGGLYYKCDSGAGRLSWETFITGAISCTDRTDNQDGSLKIGSAIELAVKSEKDSRLARFLVDFHNHVYHLHTGDAAPSAWAVTVLAVSAQPEAAAPSLLGSVLPVMGALLGGSALRKQTIRRTSTMRPTGRPTVQQDRRSHVEPPRPLHSQPHHRPIMPIGRPGSASLRRPGSTGMPGGQRRPGGAGGHGGMGGSGGQRRPGGMGGPGKGHR